MRRMSEMWDSVAPGWEANAEFVDRHLAPATEALLDAAAIGEGSAVLELACGPGGAGLCAAARVGPGGTVVLADVAPEMVAVAARRGHGRAQISTVVCDQGAIATADDRFDAVIARHGLMFAEDHVAAVREATRVLRGGGRYAAMTWGSREQNPWLGCVLDAVGEQFGVPFPPPAVRGPFSLDDPALLRNVLQDGGLEDVAVQSLATPMPAASLQAWWERVPKLAGPLAIALEGMEPEVREAIEQRALAAGERASSREGDEVVFPGMVLIGSGRAPR
jgi:ubiquinone/menaquinone biosynthesis C-methylase UbiE